jgi:hypothetical protein
MRWVDAIDGGGETVPADQRGSAEDAAKAASTKSPDSFTVQKSGLNVIANGVYPFSFAYLYEDPDNPSQQIPGPRSPNFLFTLQTPDLTQPVTNLVVTPGLLSYGVKWDLIDKALPANKWLIDIQIYESLTGAFTGEEYLVWNGNGNSATILVSSIANRWIRVDTRDQDYRKKSVVSGPFKATDPIVVDTTGPDNVSSVNASGGLDTTGIVGFNGYANISWPAITGGGIRGYRIRFRPITTPASSYSYADSPGTGTSYRLAGLGAGLTYEIAVATYDEYNNTSSSYVAGSNVTVGGTPYIASTVDVTGFFRAKANPTDADSTAFKFGYGIETGKRGLAFNASNYWHIDSNQSALFKVGGPTSNYLLWDGSKLTVDGDINAKGGNFSGNIFMSTSGASIYNGTIDSATGNLTGNGFALNSTGLKVANGVNSVTIAAATGTITANAGSIGGWSLSGSTLSKNNVILDSTGQIQVGATAANSVYLKSSGDYVIWAGNNTPDANAKFRVHKDGTLYATGATISGNITANSIAFGATYDGTSMSTIKSGAATGSTALQPNGTLTGNVSGTVGGVAVATVTAGAGRGNSAVQPGNGITVDATTKAINKIEASAGLPISTSGTRPVILDNLGLRMTNSAGTAYTVFLDASTGSAVFRGDITGASGTFSGRLASNVTDPATSSYFDSQGSLGGVSQGLVIGAIGFKNTSVGGWTSHCYPYMPGSPNIDLGTVQFRWNDVRISGSVMIGHGGSDTVGLASGPKIKLNPGGTIYANTLGTGSGNTIVQDGGYFKVQVSSLRYKENINTMGNSGFLDIVNSLRPVTYSYIGDTGNNGSPRILSGLIAEELHQIPELRTVVNYNEENEPDGIAYDRLTASLILAIQDLSNKVDSISSRLDALEG